MKRMPDDIAELARNPGLYGVPTFEEFVKNKAKYGPERHDAWLESIDRGDPLLRTRQRYRVEGYRVDSLEQAETMALNMGFNLYDDCVVDPQVVRDGERNVIEVNFRSKRTLERRAAW